MRVTGRADTPDGNGAVLLPRVLFSAVVNGTSVGAAGIKASVGVVGAVVAGVGLVDLTLVEDIPATAGGVPLGPLALAVNFTNPAGTCTLSLARTAPNKVRVFSVDAQGGPVEAHFNVTMWDYP